MSDEIPAYGGFAAGSQVAGYRLEEQIGRGGMAVVFRARDSRLGRRVALKILAPELARDDAFRQRFIRESRAAAAVDHPHIIPVFEAGESEGVLFIAMRYVVGRDVRSLLDATGPLPPGRAITIVTQVSSALDAAHSFGLVHRDVKPGNMLLDSVGGSGQPDHIYLSDFGLSKQSLSASGLTGTGQFLGTLDYVAPEQIEGKLVDGRADQYALAGAAYEMLGGAPPFRRDEGLAILWAQISATPPPVTNLRPELPEAVNGVLLKALAKAPADRYDSCLEFATALRGALGLDTRPRSVPPVPRQPTEIAMPAVSSGAQDGSAPPLGPSASAGPAAPAAPAGPAPAAAPPTEIAQVSGPRSAGPGLTEPSRPAPARRLDTPRGAGTVVAPAPRPSWWRSRAAMATAAVVVVLGAAGGIFAALHHGGTTTGSTGGGSGHGTTPVAAAVAAPPCSAQAATPKRLTGVGTGTTAVGGSPFGIAVTPDGKYSFVSTGHAVAVLNNDNGSLTPTQAAPIPAPGAQKTVTITRDGKYVLAAVSNGAYVISAREAENGDAAGAVLGQIAPSLADTSNEVYVSRNGLVFITYQNTGNVAVFNLQRAIAGHYGQAGFVGMISLGRPSMPQAMAESPDGRWLYVTGESQDGHLYLVDLAKAGTDPQGALVSSAAAGCAPARVIVSADGKYVWVTDRDSNALVAFSAAALANKAQHPLVAKVTVGQKPIGLSFVNGGSEIMVADANSGGPPGADNLVLVSTQLALHGKSGALSGFIPTGQQPRDLALEPDGKTLLSTDTKSGQLLAINVRSLP